MRTNLELPEKKGSFSGPITVTLRNRIRLLFFKLKKSFGRYCFANKILIFSQIKNSNQNQIKMKQIVTTAFIAAIVAAVLSTLITYAVLNKDDKTQTVQSVDGLALESKIVPVSVAKKYTQDYQTTNPEAIKAMNLSDDNIDSLYHAMELRGKGHSMRMYFGTTDETSEYNVLVIVPTDSKGNDAPFVYKKESSVFVIATEPKTTDLCPKLCDKSSPFYIPTKNDADTDTIDSSNDGSSADTE